MEQYKHKKILFKLSRALFGLKTSFINEVNFRRHIYIFVLVGLMSYIVQISKTEIIFALLCGGLVLTTELINTAIENICDHVTPEENFNIKKIKDISAGAVFLSAIFAAIIGLIIFVPYLTFLFQ